LIKDITTEKKRRKKIRKRGKRKNKKKKRIELKKMIIHTIDVLRE
jgi:hypothetical protein